MLNDVRLPAGRFDANVHQLFVTYAFSPTLTTRGAAQYSSLSSKLLFNFRLRWRSAPGSEAWLVYDENKHLGIPGASLSSRALIFKVVHNFIL